MEFLDEEMEEIFNIFQQESDELLEKLNGNLLKLEIQPKNTDIINELFRDAHSIKGAARMIGLNDIQLVAHKIEDIFGLAKDNCLQITPELIDILCKATDLIGSIVSDSVKTKGKFHSQNTDTIISALEEVVGCNEQDEQPQRQVLTPSPIKPVPINKNIVPDMIFTEEETSEIKLLFCEEISSQIPKIKALFAEIHGYPSDINIIDNLYSVIANIYNSSITFDEKLLKAPLETLKQKLGFILKNDGNTNAEDIKELELFFNAFLSAFSEFTQNPIDLKIEVEKPISGKIAETAFVETVVMDTIRTQDISDRRKPEQISSSQNFISEKFDSIINNIEKILHDTQITVSLIEEIDIIIKELNVGHCQNILEKAKEIFEKIQKNPSKLNSEFMQVIKEALSAAKSIYENDFSIQEDPELITQRLDILKQMLDIPEFSEDSFALAETKYPTSSQNTSVLDKESSQEAANLYKPMESSAIKTLRVDTKKLDMLVNQVGELIIAKIKTKEHLNEIEKISSALEEWYREWNKAKQSLKFMDKQNFVKTNDSILSPQKNLQLFFEESSNKIISFINNLNTLHHTIQEGDARLNLIVNDLETMVKSVRVLPLATIFHMFPRMVRDISRDKGKEIDLFISGSETSADKKVIEEIKSPLLHIIRNSIDHGIETPEERLNKGKIPVGKITLSASHLENSILIEITDDGRGIDIEKIKQKVLQKKLLTESEIEAMSDNQIMNIIFWPGFSTGEIVTEISGRGVGLDVVHTKITQLGGTVFVKSNLNEGCKVSIKLPVTMATIKSFLISVNKQIFAIPTSCIKTVQWVNINDIFHKEGKPTIIVDNKTVPISNLAEILELDNTNPEVSNKKLVIMVIETEGVQVGFIIDKLLGEQEILHKNLTPPLIRIRNLAGITTLGSGEVCLILNITDLIKSAFSDFNTNRNLIEKIKPKTKKESRQKHILVVDDSLTTRILERNILKAAGYKITVATNGLDALTKLSTETFDLIVSDVEMPEINGFEFTERIRKDDKTKEIPVILVTSLAKETDRQKGIICGANAYITKGEFNQQELLNTIEKLINNEA